MRYKSIKNILRHQVNKNVKALWTFNEDKKTFTYLYGIITDDLRIYTPQQLLDYLDEISL